MKTIPLAVLGATAILLCQSFAAEQDRFAGSWSGNGKGTFGSTYSIDLDLKPDATFVMKVRYFMPKTPLNFNATRDDILAEGGWTWTGEGLELIIQKAKWESADASSQGGKRNPVTLMLEKPGAEAENKESEGGVFGVAEELFKTKPINLFPKEDGQLGSSSIMFGGKMLEMPYSVNLMIVRLARK